MRILDTKLIASLFDMVNTTEKDIHLLKSHISSFGHQEDDKNAKAKINTSKEEECVARFLLANAFKHEGSLCE
jgi:hypothetical protein